MDAGYIIDWVYHTSSTSGCTWHCIEPHSNYDPTDDTTFTRHGYIPLTSNGGLSTFGNHRCNDVVPIGTTSNQRICEPMSPCWHNNYAPQLSHDNFYPLSSGTPLPTRQILANAHISHPNFGCNNGAGGQGTVMIAINNACGSNNIWGCMDDTAINYCQTAQAPCNSNQTHTCSSMFTQTHPTGNSPGDCCEYGAWGCYDSTASNYDSTAVEGCPNSNNTPNPNNFDCCEYVGCPDDTYHIGPIGSGGNTLFGVNSLTTNIPTGIWGCDPNSTGSPDSNDWTCCEYEGCLNPNAFNGPNDPTIQSIVDPNGNQLIATYDCGGNPGPWSVTSDDSCCEIPLAGCNESTSNNYDPLAYGCDVGGTPTPTNTDCCTGCPSGANAHPLTPNGCTINSNTSLPDPTDISCCNYIIGCADSTAWSPVGSALAGGPNTNASYMAENYIVGNQGCADPITGAPDSNNFDCCSYFGCLDGTASNYEGNSSGCPDQNGISDPNDITCCEYNPISGCLDDGNLPSGTTPNPNPTIPAINFNGFSQGNSYIIGCNLTPGDYGCCEYFGCLDTSTNVVNYQGPLYPVMGCEDNTNQPDPNNFDCCDYYGCTDPMSDSTHTTYFMPGSNCNYGMGGTGNDCNFDPISTFDCNGQPTGTNSAGWNSCCTYPIFGCTDNLTPVPGAPNGASNYNINADGCEQGATPSNPNPTTNILLDPTDYTCCDYNPVWGCQDSTAQGPCPQANYQPNSGGCDPNDPQYSTDPNFCCVYCDWGCDDITYPDGTINNPLWATIITVANYDPNSDGCDPSIGGLYDCCEYFGCNDDTPFPFVVGGLSGALNYDITANYIGGVGGSTCNPNTAPPLNTDPFYCCERLTYGCNNINFPNSTGTIDPATQIISFGVFGDGCEDINNPGFIDPLNNDCCDNSPCANLEGCTDPNSLNNDPTLTAGVDGCIPLGQTCPDPNNFSCCEGCVDDGNQQYSTANGQYPTGYSGIAAINNSAGYGGCDDDGVSPWVLNITDTNCCDYPTIIPVEGCTDATFPPLGSNNICGAGCKLYDSALDPLIDGCLDAFGTVQAGDTSCCCTEGCTNGPGPVPSPSPNYDPNACVDNGSCITPLIPGCPDPNIVPPFFWTLQTNACFNCEMYNTSNPGDGCEVNGNIVQNDTSCCCIMGCLDDGSFYGTNINSGYVNNQGGTGSPFPNFPASNVDPNACLDDGSCSYVPPVAGCNDPSIQGAITGTSPFCTGPNACEAYDPSATGCEDPLTGIIDILDTSCCCTMGCTDPNAVSTGPGSYNPGACIDDPNDPCQYPTLGCTDPLVQGTIIASCVGTCNEYDPLATQDDGSCCTIGCTDSTASNPTPGACIDDGSCIPYGPPGCSDNAPIDPMQLPLNNTCGQGGGPLIPGTPPNPPYVFSAENTSIWWSTPNAGCPDAMQSGTPPDPNITNCCEFYGCLDPTATNYTPTWPDNYGNPIPTSGCPVWQGMGSFEGDPNNTCCCEYPPMLDCQCCDNGAPVSMTPIIATTSGGCSSLNGGNFSNCADATTFDPNDCYDCSTYNFTNSNSPMLVDAYNLGVTNGQAYGILDGNSMFCVEACTLNNSPHWACSCCGDVHHCEDDSTPPTFGCWTCHGGTGGTSCFQPGGNWLTQYPNLNYYNTQPDCAAQMAIDCPPTPSCSNDPNFCSENPSLTQGGACWLCHMGTECMPVYDYLQFGSGPPGSTGTQAFMMGWLVPGIIGQTNQTPQGSDLYCTEQDCMAQSGCSAYSGMDYGWRCKEGWKPGIGGTCVQGTQNNPGPFAYKQDCLNSGCEPISIDPKDTKIVTPFTIDPLSKIILLKEQDLILQLNIM